MKTLRCILALLVVVFASASAWSQQKKVYTVIKVSGKIHSYLLKREIRTGDQITPADQLSFDSGSAYVHVINPEGRKTLRNIPDKSPRDLIVLLEKFQAHDKRYLKSRGGINQYIENLSYDLAHDTLLILGAGRIGIDTSQLSLRDPCGIKAIYEIGGNRVEKTVSGASGFALGRDRLFDPGSAGPYPKVTLQYLTDLKDSFFSTAITIASFTPHYADEAALKGEVKAIVRSLDGIPRNGEQAVREVFSYLSSEYAPPVEENLKAWLAENRLTD